MTHTLNNMPNSFAPIEANGESLADDPVILAWQRLALAKKNDADKNALIEVCHQFVIMTSASRDRTTPCHSTDWEILASFIFKATKILVRRKAKWGSPPLKMHNWS
jgi:hypothetical protein